MNVYILASGSSGNGTLIEHNGKFIMVDAGIALKDFMALFKQHGEPEGLFITHSHSDHIKSAGAVGRKIKIPVYLHSANYEKKQKIFNNVKVQFIDPGIKPPTKLFNNELQITPFSTQHDCEACVGYIIEDLVAKKKLCYLTDTGSFTRLMYEMTKDCDAYIIETDYDDEFLNETVEYDDILKQRIRSDFGHLSNKQVIEFCKNLDLDKVQFICLVHLSKITNSSKRVYELFGEAFPDHIDKFIVEPINQKLEILSLLMEYKTTEKTLILLSPAELMLIPPKYSIKGKCYYDVPDDCIVVDIRRQPIEDEPAEFIEVPNQSSPPDFIYSKSNKKYKYRVIGVEILVRYNADLSKLEQVISIAQEHDVYIIDYRVESMKMLRK
ncbi:MAG: MBL fold metallo-hydrolase, partial [Candidatus Pacearchaeota archaeon]